MFAKEFISPKNVYCLKIKLKQLPRVCILLRNLWNFTKKEYIFNDKNENVITFIA